MGKVSPIGPPVVAPPSDPYMLALPRSPWPWLKPPPPNEISWPGLWLLHAREGYKHCGKYVCLSVCLSAGVTRKPHRGGRTSPEVLYRVACGRGSVLLRRRCDVLCTSGFVGDVMFSHSSPMARHGGSGGLRSDSCIWFSEGFLFVQLVPLLSIYLRGRGENILFGGVIAASHGFQWEFGGCARSGVQRQSSWSGSKGVKSL